MYPTLVAAVFAAMKVRSIVWSADDTKMVSCGLDGAVYEWDAASGRRTGESVLKSCAYTCVDVTPDGKTTFAVGSDKKLKEVSDSQVGPSLMTTGSSPF